MEERKMSFEQLVKLLEKKLDSEFIEKSQKLQDTELVDFFIELTKEQQFYLLKIIPNEKISRLLSYIAKDEQREFFATFTPEKNAHIIENMAPDDAVDLLANIENTQIFNETLSFVEEEKKEKIETLLPFTEDSAGGIMTSELCACPPDITIEDARKAISKKQVNDSINFVYVVEPQSEVLLGSISFFKLIGAKPKTLLKELIEKDYVWVSSGTDQEEVIQLFRRYNLSVIPVVNERHQLIGRITADDILEASVEEAGEDISKMAGTPDLIEQVNNQFSIIKLRLPWLLMTMALALVNSAIISKLLDSAGNHIALAIFIPVIMAMGGNTGMQSATIYVRELALGRSEKKLRSIAFRETKLGFFMGIVCGLFGGLISLVILNFLHTPIETINSSLVATIVGFSILNAMTFSSCFGAIIPAILHRVRIDPAVSAGPFITTLNDITAVIIYFLTNLLLVSALI